VLSRNRTSLDQRDEGFTLIELLVVIIGMAAVANPEFLNQRKKGYDAQAKSDLRTLATMQETYLTDNSSYATLTQLVTAGFRSLPNSGAASVLAKWRKDDGEHAHLGAGRGDRRLHHHRLLDRNEIGDKRHGGRLNGGGPSC